MTYIVVTGYDKRSGLLHTVAVNSATGEAVNDYGFIRQDQVVALSKQGGVALNFSVDANGNLVQDCGMFTRFSPHGSAVITAEVRNQRGNITGYVLLSCANSGSAVLKASQIIQREKSMPDGEHFVQNAILRGSSIVCYPGKKFPVIVDKSNSAPVKDVDMYAPERILCGADKDPVAKMSKERLGSVLNGVFKLSATEIKQQSSGGVVPKSLYSRLANMVNWVLKIPEDDRKVDAIMQMCKVVPGMAGLFLEDDFCRQCPDLDRFIDRNAMKIIQTMTDSTENKADSGAKVTYAGKMELAKNSEQFDKALGNLIQTVSSMQAANGGNVTENMYTQCGNMISWIVAHPEPLNVNGITRVRNELPDVAVLLFSEDFCKKYCPSVDTFFDRQALKYGFCGVVGDYDAIEILGGRSRSPASGIEREKYISLLSRMIVFVKKRISVDSGVVTDRLRGHIGNMLTWITQVPETKRAVSSMRKVRDELPQIGDLILNAGFCKEFPSVDAFFESNASALMDTNAPIEF